MPKGVLFKINGITVTPPDVDVWAPISIGTSLTGLQKRSPYRRLEWQRSLGDACDLDWLEYDDTILTSLTCRSPDKLDEYTTYTTAICQSVTLRYSRGIAEEIIATFLVITE